MSEPFSEAAAVRPAAAHATCVTLTRSAAAEAERHGLGATLAALVLPDNALVGDMVTVPAGTTRNHFAIVRRCWVVEASAVRLEIMLDYPARR